MLKLIKVVGSSLYPEYREGDYVMVITVPFFRFKKGDTIIFQHPTHGRMIKNIDRIESDKIQVKGTHPDTIDSRRFGPIDRDTVLGKVIWHIKRPRS
jgi:phage repressor protein C with HTH and peptisase S24 domain